MQTNVLRVIMVMALFTAAATLPVLAERGDDSARKSKNGSVTGQIDGVAVSLEFGRPNVNGRQIWGGLVPYGSVWRTGADEATTISFDRDVVIDGESLAAGTYGLFTIPAQDEWTFVLNQVAEQWGAFGYDPEQDALRFQAVPRQAEHVESLEFLIEGASVVLRWEKLAVGFDVAAAP